MRHDDAASASVQHACAGGAPATAPRLVGSSEGWVGGRWAVGGGQIDAFQCVLRWVCPCVCESLSVFYSLSGCTFGCNLFYTQHLVFVSTPSGDFAETTKFVIINK